jgi:hypothetical protein
MPGTGNHQICPGQDLLFCIDATIDFEFLIISASVIPCSKSLASLARPSEWPV